MNLFHLLAFVGATSALTCYNGMKMLSLQSMGQTTEDCPSASYCYNMSSSAYGLINVVKAGCSTWRCMLAKDTCIFTTFQMVPVSLCCCSYDRCNVGGNPVYSDNPAQITQGGGSNWGGNSNNNNWNSGSNSNGGFGNGGGNAGGGSWGATDQNNNNGWGNNNNGEELKLDAGSSYSANVKEEKMTKQSVGGANAAPGKHPKMTNEQIQNAFKFSIDDRGDEIQLEDDFKKIDKNYKVGAAPPKKKSG